MIQLRKYHKELIETSFWCIGLKTAMKDKFNDRTIFCKPT